jgi:hypothetical protein
MFNIDITIDGKTHTIPWDVRSTGTMSHDLPNGWIITVARCRGKWHESVYDEQRIARGFNTHSTRVKALQAACEYIVSEITEPTTQGA